MICPCWCLLRDGLASRAGLLRACEEVHALEQSNFEVQDLGMFGVIVNADYSCTPLLHVLGDCGSCPVQLGSQQPANISCVSGRLQVVTRFIKPYMVRSLQGGIVSPWFCSSQTEACL